jgi:hypothetical protein
MHLSVTKSSQQCNVCDLAVIVDTATFAAKPFGAVGIGQVERTCQVFLGASVHLPSVR